MVLILRVSEIVDLCRSACIVDVVERRSPGNPQRDMLSVSVVSPISKSNLNVPNCFGVTSIPF